MSTGRRSALASARRASNSALGMISVLCENCGATTGKRTGMVWPLRYRSIASWSSSTIFSTMNSRCFFASLMSTSATARHTVSFSSEQGPAMRRSFFGSKSMS